MAALSPTQRLARELADALGGSWRWEQPEDTDETFPTGFVRDSEGRELSMSIETYGARKGRIEIRGALPRRDAKGDYYDTGLKAPSIGVSGDRGVDAIAREVQRRLLPDYEPLFQRASEAIARRNEYLTATTDTVGAIVQAVPGLEWSVRSESSASFDVPSGGGYGDIQAHGDNVTFESRSLTRDQVIRMLKALAE